jgi:hypothetical protein
LTTKSYCMSSNVETPREAESFPTNCSPSSAQRGETSFRHAPWPPWLSEKFGHSKPHWSKPQCWWPHLDQLAALPGGPRSPAVSGVSRTLN